MAKTRLGLLVNSVPAQWVHLLLQMDVLLLHVLQLSSQTLPLFMELLPRCSLCVEVRGVDLCLHREYNKKNDGYPCFRVDFWHQDFNTDVKAFIRPLTCAWKTDICSSSFSFWKISCFMRSILSCLATSACSAAVSRCCSSSSISFCTIWACRTWGRWSNTSGSHFTTFILL